MLVRDDVHLQARPKRAVGVLHSLLNDGSSLTASDRLQPLLAIGDRLPSSSPFKCILTFSPHEANTFSSWEPTYSLLQLRFAFWRTRVWCSVLGVPATPVGPRWHARCSRGLTWSVRFGGETLFANKRLCALFNVSARLLQLAYGPVNIHIDGCPFAKATSG